jgi:catechol 2,3-dioxygenase-like lactoylglutathione lyase family enzyme
MRINIASVLVDNQEKALRFYTEVRILYICCE